MKQFKTLITLIFAAFCLMASTGTTWATDYDTGPPEKQELTKKIEKESIDLFDLSQENDMTCYADTGQPPGNYSISYHNNNISTDQRADHNRDAEVLHYDLRLQRPAYLLYFNSAGFVSKVKLKDDIIVTSNTYYPLIE